MVEQVIHQFSSVQFSHSVVQSEKANMGKCWLCMLEYRIYDVSISIFLLCFKYFMFLFSIEFWELKFQFLIGWKQDIKFLRWRENEGEWLLNPGISAPPAWATPRSLGQGLTTSSDLALGASPDKPTGTASFLHTNNSIHEAWSSLSTYLWLHFLVQSWVFFSYVKQKKKKEYGWLR